MPRKPYVPPTEKICTKCKILKPVDQFHPRKDRPGPEPQCIQCKALAHESWRERNPGASRARNLKSKYGISPDQYLKMLEEQGGGCAMCHSPDSKWKSSPWLHVDHNHETGEVRELLCHKCNIVAGYIESGEVSMSSLVAYLDRHGITPG